ncbi:hypothetical protein Efla_006350 [Eimeria flavescens]
MLKLAGCGGSRAESNSSSSSSMSGRTVPRVTPLEYQPGLLDAGGLPVRVRHIFDRYRQQAGWGGGPRSNSPYKQGPPDKASSIQLASSPQVEAGAAASSSSSLLGVLSKASSLSSPLELQRRQQQPPPPFVRQPAAQVGGEADYEVLPDGVGIDSQVTIEEGTPLLVETYTGVIEAGKEQEFAIVLLSRTLPANSLIIHIADGEILCKTFLIGRTLRATLPPLLPGRHSVSLRDPRGASYSVRVGASGLLFTAKEAAAADALPLVVLPYPPSRRQPRLSYSTNRHRRPPETAEASALPPGPFTAAELEAFVAVTQKQLASSSSRREGPLLPAGRQPQKEGRLTRGGTDTFEDRIRKCLQSAYGQRTPLLRPPDGASAFVPDDLSDCRVPLAFKASLFSSCQESTRNAIAYFHSELFEFLPFGVVSAHIFTKSHASDELTIFAFSLMPSEARRFRVSVPSDSPRRSGASLDRFEVSERLCADTRHWTHTDTCVPAKNEEAANYTFDTNSGAQCPVPQALRHSMNPYRDYPEGIEVGPFVYLYFEPWPEEALPMPAPRPPAATSSTSSTSSSTGSRPEKEAPAARSAAAGGQASGPPGSGGGSAAAPAATAAGAGVGGPYFSVSVCVGKYIFSSVLGVHLKVLSAIFNEWLPQVPLKQQAAELVLRAKMKEAVGPVLNPPPSS